MFKKLGLLVLAVNGVYAMESLPTTPAENNSIKQTIEDAKHPQVDNKNQNNSKNKVNDFINEFSIFGINKTTQQLSNTNVEIHKISNRKEPFDFNSLKGKFFIDMTPDEQNWMQLMAYDMFSKSCQEFYQKILRQKELTDSDKEELFRTPGFTLCIRSDINPLRVLDDEIRFNLHPLCLMAPNLEKVQKQVWDFTDEVIKRTAKIKARIIKFYAFKKLNHITDTTLALKVFLHLQQNNYKKTNV